MWPFPAQHASRPEADGGERACRDYRRNEHEPISPVDRRMGSRLPALRCVWYVAPSVNV